MNRKILLLTAITLSFFTNLAIAQAGPDIYTFAGIAGIGGYAGDGGRATIANLNGPTGIAVDTAGNVYVADTRNNVIRLVTTSGIITTFAGTAGMGGYTGDGGAATSAQLNAPAEVAIDAAGNVYIADTRNDVIRIVNTSGTISTFAGSGGPGGYTGDGGPATAAKLNRPGGIAIDATGNVYIADTRNNVIREVTAGTGIINTIAGNNAAGAGYSGDGSAATAAQLYNPAGITLDGSGNLYIADTRNNVVRIVNTASGIINTFAGNNAAGPGYTGDGGLATAAQLNTPYDVKADAAGNIFIADRSNAAIREVNTSNTITTFAGNGTAGYSGDGGPATAAEINGPEGLAIDSAHNIYISCTAGDVIRRAGAAVTGITITSNTGDTVCYSTLVSFTATAIADTAPHYQWVLNGAYAGTDTSFFTPTGFATGNTVYCILYNAAGDTLALSGTLRIDSLPNSGVINGPSVFCVGSVANITDNTGGPGGGFGGGGGTWLSTDSMVVSVAPGFGPGGPAEAATALMTGTDTIYYISSNVCGTDSAALVVSVVTNTLTPISGPDSVCAGATVTYTDASAPGVWTVIPPFGNTIDSLTGVFTAGNFVGGGFGGGFAVIGYGEPGCTETLTVTVVRPPAIGAITGAATLDSGATTLFTDALPGGTWSSSPASIATIDPLSGTVYGVSSGIATITYSETANGCTSDTTVALTVVNTAGVAIISNTSAFHIYPNPVTNLLNISWDKQNAGTCTVTIANVAGKTVYTATVDMKTYGSRQCDISALKPGVYMVAIQSANGYYCNKLVVGE